MLRSTIYNSGARGIARTVLRSNFHPTCTPLRSLTQRTYISIRSLKGPTSFTLTAQGRPSPSGASAVLQRFRSLIRFFHNSRPRLNGKPTSPNPTPHFNSPGGSGAAAAESTSLTGRLKKLSREYGWSAVGVYFALSALDFPFCYLLVRSLGTEKIGEWEHVVVSNVGQFVPDSVKQTWKNGKQTWNEWRASMKTAEHDATGGEQASDAVEMAGWGVEEADEKNKKEASLGTQLALAYAIHKSFIFVRVPLAAAVTPRVVKLLRGWGWDIGKRTTKEAKALNRAALPPKKKKKKRPT